MRYLIDTNILLFAIREEDRLSKEVSLTLGKLAPIPDHKDPVDHAIMAHAITNKTTLISSDNKMRFYQNQGLDFIWNRI